MSKVLLGDVAYEHKEACKGRENTFTKLFRKGNVLFGRRRAYLKKAAVAPFDGICSGDIAVSEADPDKILPEPDMDKQKELVEFLWVIDETKKSYQELIAVTDELVKFQFVEPANHGRLTAHATSERRCA